MDKLTLKEHLNNKLLPYKIALPIALSLFTAVLTAYTVLLSYSDSNESFAKAIAPHISTLIESQDRPELQRFITAITREKDIKLEVYQSGKAIASSHDSEVIGSSIKNEGVNFFGISSSINFKNLISQAAVKRFGGPLNLEADIKIYASTAEIFSVLVIISILIFILSFLTLNILTSKIISSAQESIEPIRELEESIKNLNLFGEINPSHIEIKELESIYSAIVSTNSKLKISKDKLAKEKAKELTIGAYQKLIHDLHTPIAALKQMIKVINKESITQEQRDFAKVQITELAEQILLQVKASKSNIIFEVSPKLSNITESVRRAANQAQLAKSEVDNIELIEEYDDSISALHDNTMFGRAVSNIVVNAIEACKEVVKVSVKKIGKEISISVSDDGAGISKQDVSLFLQGRGKSNKKNGLGIGLASANHIVSLHGGKIIYKTSPLGGACFDIRIQG